MVPDPSFPVPDRIAVKIADKNTTPADLSLVIIDGLPNLFNISPVGIPRVIGPDGKEGKFHPVSRSNDGYNKSKCRIMVFRDTQVILTISKNSKSFMLV